MGPTGVPQMAVLMGMIRDDDHPMDLVTLFSDKAIRCEGKCAAFGTSHDWPADLSSA